MDGPETMISTAQLDCHLAVKQAIDSSAIHDKEAAYKGYLTAVEGKSNATARDIAKDIVGKQVFWDWDRELRIFTEIACNQLPLPQFPRLVKVTITILEALRSDSIPQEYLPTLIPMFLGCY